MVQLFCLLIAPCALCVWLPSSVLVTPGAVFLYSVINLTAVADVHYGYQEDIVADFVDNAVIADAEPINVLQACKSFNVALRQLVNSG